MKTRFQSPDYKKIYYDASKNALNRGVLFRGLYQGVGSVILITIPSCESNIVMLKKKNVADFPKRVLSLPHMRQ